MKLSTYKKMAPDIHRTLTEALRPFGLVPAPFGARIDSALGTVQMKLVCRDINHKAADGTETTPERELYKTSCTLFDMKPEWLGQTFPIGLVDYKLLGFLSRRSKKFVAIQRVSDRKTYIATPDQVSHAFIVKAALADRNQELAGIRSVGHLV
jgi:hypothetical protein